MHTFDVFLSRVLFNQRQTICNFFFSFVRFFALFLGYHSANKHS